jgi:GT2 family glycosyltransferase
MVDYFGAILFALIALFWAVQGTRAVRGMARLPTLVDAPLLEDGRYPRVSILVAARNEATKLPAALPSLLVQDYSNYEVIVVNDRSQDETPQILDEFDQEYGHLRVIHLMELPPGWLGKPHALTQAYQQATGQWLLFTDADVHFAPDLLKRSLSLAVAQGWDHVTLLPFGELEGFWEKTAITYWVGTFALGLKPWRVSNPKAKEYVGVGAFQLVRRSTYEAIGTHQRLAMEVVEDVKLGKLVKLGGFCSGVALGEKRLHIRWVEGLGEYVRNLSKNMFAACGFSVSYALLLVVLSLAMTVLPLGGLLFASGAGRYLSVVCVLAAGLTHMKNGVRLCRASPLYALTFPLGAALLSYTLLRSMVVTLWRGGVLWRDTFYPLKDLRKGLV